MRFVTYNIRHGHGMDHRVSIRRIADVLASLEPDVAGLNEVRRVPGLSDQPRRLAEMLGMRAVFQHNHGPALVGQGNLVLVRGEAAPWADITLPGGIETRGCLVVHAVVDGHAFLFATTHLSLGRSARSRQLSRLRALLPFHEPFVLSGDFNCGLDEATALGESLTLPADVPATYPSRRPRRQLDHIGWTRDWRLVRLEAVDSLASDHLPLVADLDPAAASARPFHPGESAPGLE